MNLFVRAGRKIGLESGLESGAQVQGPYWVFPSVSPILVPKSEIAWCHEAD